MRHYIHFACWSVAIATSPVLAGMPAPLPGPTDRESEMSNLVTRLSEFGILRFQTISFFIAVFLLSALMLQWLWNWLGRDFTWLPRLTYLRAVGIVFLWSLLFVIVLTMISGARELMTPGAWRKQGFTYKLADEARPAAALDRGAERRQHLEKLRLALWHFAATHQGRFPKKDEMSAIANELWQVPGPSGLSYLYISGRTAGHVDDLLAYEPELDSGPRFILCVNGDILQKGSAEIDHALKEPNQP